jgi:plastocyanin
MRRGLVVVLAVLSMMLGSFPAWAVTTIGIASSAFDPAKVRVSQGEDVRWSNTDPFDHTSTQDGALKLWNTGHIAGSSTSSSVSLLAAGSYPYHCNIHTFMHGIVKVPIQIAPGTGTTSTTFAIALASATQTGFTYDIQRKIGSGSWKSWQTGVSTSTVSYTDVAGTYAFRSRLRRTSNDGKSGWSPAKTITIS